MPTRAGQADAMVACPQAARPGRMLDLSIKGITAALRHASIHAAQRGAALEDGGEADHRKGGDEGVFLREGASSPGPICNRLVGLKNEAWPEGFLSGRAGRPSIMTRAIGERVRCRTRVKQLDQMQRAVRGKARH